MIIRKARLEDVQGILNIRNNEKIRTISLEKDLIGSDQHIMRFTNFLKNKENILMVAQHINGIEGYCRLHNKDGKTLVSIAILPTYQGKGLGTKLLQAALSNLPGGQEVVAEIIETNIPSIKFFEKNGFIYVGENNKICSYLYKKNDD